MSKKKYSIAGINETWIPKKWKLFFIKNSGK